MGTNDILVIRHDSLRTPRGTCGRLRPEQSTNIKHKQLELTLSWRPSPKAPHILSL
jgi:hypothetical protein